MRVVWGLCLVVLALGAVGCAASYQEDLQVICHPERVPGVEEAADLDQKQKMIAAWQDERIKSEEGRAFFEAFPAAPPGEKPAILRRELERAGVAPESCPYLETLQPLPEE